MAATPAGNLYAPSNTNPVRTGPDYPTNPVRPGSAPPSVQQHVQQNQPGPVTTAPGPGTTTPAKPDYGPPQIPVGTIQPKKAPGGSTVPLGQGSPEDKALWEQSNHDPATFAKNWAQAHGVPPDQTPQTTNQIVDALRGVGFNADYEGTDEYGRSAGMTYNGQPYKLINGSGDWMFDTYENAEGSGGGGNDLDQVLNSPLLKGFDEQFSYDPFIPPTGVTEQNDPGYLERLKEGTKAMENTAASHGTLLTGGTVKAENQFAQDFASNEFQNVYNRNQNTWQTNYNKALGEYQQRANIYSNNQANKFNRLSAMSGTGQSAANSANASGRANANAQSDLTTGSANSQAGADVAAGNARGGAVAGAGSTIGGIYAGSGTTRQSNPSTGDYTPVVGTSSYGPMDY